MPYRSLCESCVHGRGKQKPHFQLLRDLTKAPVFQLDYCFPGPLKVLSVIEVVTGFCACTVVVTKGSSDVHAVRFILAYLEDGGWTGDIVLQADGEPAMQDVICSVAEKWSGGRSEVRSTPRGSSSSNGSVERLHATIQGLIRTYRHQVEKAYDVVLENAADLLVWIVR